MKLKYKKCKPYFLKKLYSTNVEVLCQSFKCLLQFLYLLHELVTSMICG